MQDSDGLQTIDRTTLAVPETRIKSATSAQDFARRLVQNDDKRSKKRALVNGLLNGNPPYKASALKAANRAGACNVNWNIARAYLESGAGAFYDLFSEAPGYITVRTEYGTPEQQETWGHQLSAEADRVLREERIWDYTMQLSQQEMVYHGPGPLFFEGGFEILPVAVRTGELKVPEGTKSDTKYWDGCIIVRTYFPPQLYDFIRNEKAAAAVGWDVEHTKRVIANAMDIKSQPGIVYDWEFYQQELKNNSISYFDDTKVCRLAHVFWKEFDGRISHGIVERETTTTTNGGYGKATAAALEKSADTKYLYLKVGRYKDWLNAVHPMYFDRGDGGEHHAVTGLGVKMFAAMEYQNRLICNLCDKAFAPHMMFKPTTTEAAQKFQLAVFGDYAVLPAGFEGTQAPVAGIMNDGLAMQQTISGLLQSNLSSYRQQVPMRERGNPATKYEKELEASQQSALNKTQFNRYYAQLDALYAEIYRRLSNLNTPNPKAKEFQARCKKLGIPKEAMVRVSLVQATRVVGQGSAFMRKQAVDALFAVVGSLPEDGRTNLIDDKIAAEAGQAAVARYNPKKAQVLPSDQEAEALQWVAAMKVGVPPVITSSQNAFVYATTYLKAAVQAITSLQQGANPVEVLGFLHTVGPAIAGQLRRMAMDPTRQQEFKALSQQWQKLASLTDQLTKQVQQMQQQSQQQQQQTDQVMTDAQLDAFKVQSDVKLKQLKTVAQLQQSNQKHQQKLAMGAQDMALKDAQTAAQIMLDKAQARADAELSAMEPATTE
jgi:hypothetical protein